MTKQDKMKINNLLVRIKQIEDEIERLRLFDNQIEANYNRVFDYGVTNRIMLDEQCRKIGELKKINGASVEDKNRERKITERLTEKYGEENRERIENLYGLIFSESKNSEEKIVNGKPEGRKKQ